MPRKKEGKEAKELEGFLLIYPDLDTAVECNPGESNTIAFGKHVKCTGTKVIFRVYEKDENGQIVKKNGVPVRKDYQIRHHDLKVKLLSGSLYETPEGNYIDY